MTKLENVTLMFAHVDPVLSGLVPQAFAEFARDRLAEHANAI